MLQRIADACPEALLVPLSSKDYLELESWLATGTELKRNRVRAVRRMPTGILKEYLGRGAETRAGREFHNLVEVGRLGLPAPRPFWVDKIYNRVFVLMEDLGDYPTLGEVLAGPPSGAEVIEKLGVLVASLAQAGAQHRDLQAGNILVRDGGFAVVDWGAATMRPGPLLEGETLDMALGLLASLEPLSLRDQVTWLRRALPPGPRRCDEIRGLFAKRRVRWERHFKSRARKALEESSSWARLNLKGLAVHQRNLDPEAVKAALTQMPKAPFLKDDVRRRLWTLSLGTEEAVAKEFLEPNVLRRMVGRTPVRLSWLAQADLQARGLAIPAPRAFWERPNGSGVILMEKIRGVGLDRCLHGDWPRMNEMERRNVEGQVATLLSALCLRSCLPGDLKACNILIAENRAVLVDLDGVRRGKDPHPEDMSVALTQLNTSIPRAVSWRARARVLVSLGLGKTVARRLWMRTIELSRGLPLVYQGVVGDVHEVPL